ncbi:MAG: phosphotransferase [Burkholderiales bacterium]|nr:phosphotransferase [Burkholderiales bacterium]
MERLHLIENWLNDLYPGATFSLEPASSDASFRRYFRVKFGDRSLIVMDAPPSREDCRPFLKVAELFAKSGLHLPEVLEKDLDKGFLLLSDLGSTTYLDRLDEANADLLYRDAIDSLVKMQQASIPGLLPEYDEALLRREMNLFPEWYLKQHLGEIVTEENQAILGRVFSKIVENCLAQPKVFVHRDYHSRNLMLTEPNPGILDFQDAVYGPITYDLVSLLRDAYISWEEEKVLDWAIRYWEKARAAGLPVSGDFAQFYRDFEWMGAQRQLKVLGIFARLHHRDGKAQYLDDIPLVLSYLRKTCMRYSELSPLLRVLGKLEVGTTF